MFGLSANREVTVVLICATLSLFLNVFFFEKKLFLNVSWEKLQTWEIYKVITLHIHRNLSRRRVEEVDDYYIILKYS